jgi:hypothetical protein
LRWETAGVRVAVTAVVLERGEGEIGDARAAGRLRRRGAGGSRVGQRTLVRRDRRVVPDDDLAVGGQVQVEFQRRDAQVECGFEGGQRVLGLEAAAPR